MDGQSYIRSYSIIKMSKLLFPTEWKCMMISKGLEVCFYFAFKTVIVFQYFKLYFYHNKVKSWIKKCTQFMNWSKNIWMSLYRTCCAAHLKGSLWFFRVVMLEICNVRKWTKLRLINISIVIIILYCIVFLNFFLQRNITRVIMLIIIIIIHFLKISISILITISILI